MNKWWTNDEQLQTIKSELAAIKMLSLRASDLTLKYWMFRLEIIIVQFLAALQIFSTFMLRFLAATRQVRGACVHVHLRSQSSLRRNVIPCGDFSGLSWDEDNGRDVIWGSDEGSKQIQVDAWNQWSVTSGWTDTDSRNFLSWLGTITFTAHTSQIFGTSGPLTSCSEFTILMCCGEMVIYHK